MPVVLLSEDEEAAVVRHGCKSRLPIVVAGQVEQRARNILEVDGKKVEVDTAEFALFLQLVLYQHWDTGGWVPITHLQFWSTGRETQAGDLKAKVEKSLARLRGPFRARFVPITDKDLFHRQAGRVRLSTHPRYVSGDWATLQGHNHPGVAQLATQVQAIVAGMEGRQNAA